MALLLAASCSDDEDTEPADGPSPSASAITLNAAGSRFLPWESRATVVTGDNLKERGFDVWAFCNDSIAWMGNEATGVRFINTDTQNPYSVDDGNGRYWGYASADSVAYWPNPTKSYDGTTVTYPTVDFYAVYPSNHDVKTIKQSETGYNTIKINAKAKTITYDCSNDGRKQIDMMVAVEKDKTKKNGVATMNFKHVLSQIVFTGKTASDDITVILARVYIHQIHKRGTYDLTKQKSWELTTDTTYYPNGRAKDITINSTTTAVDLTDTERGPLILLPQKVDAASITAGTQTAPDKTVTGAYLEINGQIKSGDTWILGSSGHNASIYYPLTVDWEPGKKYIYNLIFGQATKAAASVSDWK